MEGLEPGGSGEHVRGDAPVLEARGLTKAYGDSVVLDNVDITVHAGEVRALLGENGAGKSTFIKIVSGVVRPSAGTMAVDGAGFEPTTPQSATAAGVATVHQELAIAPGLSIAENVFLGRDVASSLGFVRWKRLRARAKEVFETLGFGIDVTQEAGSASPIEQAMTALARAFSQDASVLILDEPTAALTDAEVSDLFAAIRRVQQRGVGVLYVSHRLEEVRALAESYSILRDGVLVDDGNVADVEVDDLIAKMAGRRIDDVFPERSHAREPVLLAVRDLRSRGLNHASIDVHEGEILGIAGLAGAGRSELLRSMAGAQRRRGGTMRINDEPYAPSSPGAAQRRGVVFVPEERRRDGLLPDSVARNINVTTIGKHAGWGALVSSRQEAEHAAENWERYDIRGSGLGQEVLRLSGGNQQKVVLAKFLALDPRIVLLDEPTRGVDVSTKAEIYRLIKLSAQEGVVFVVVSSELPELLGLCHRIAVMHEGVLSAPLDAATTTEHQLLAACYGRRAA